MKIKVTSYPISHMKPLLVFYKYSPICFYAYVNTYLNSIGKALKLGLVFLISKIW